MQTSFWDMSPSLQSSGSDTQPSGSASDSPTCTCISETSECSIHPRSLDEWTASMRAFLAKTLALPDMAAVLKASEAVSGRKLSGALMQYDPESSSLKTAQQSFLEDSTECYQTLPRWGSMRNGVVYQQAQLVRPTDAIGGGCLQDVPTPTTQDAHNNGGPSQMRRKTPPLNAVVRQWPTPTVGSTHAGHTLQEWGGSQNWVRKEDPELAGGKLNPAWVEWLMGWPIGSTASQR